MSITFSSCFYIMKSKFDTSLYIEWMTNFVSIVNHFNLVIYTDENSRKYIPEKTLENQRIKIVIKPLGEFYNYKYKDSWIENHKKNLMINDKTCWELNMLWSEKIMFVKETVEKKYYDTNFYGWCDIGYFRNRLGDIHTTNLKNWCNCDKINQLDKNKVHYACINNDNRYLNYLSKMINKKNAYGLPVNPIPPIQQSVSGGFFILHKDKINWWASTYDNKLELYFKHNYLVKDDQIILADCVFSNVAHFSLFRENVQKLDNWFMFQRILIQPLH